MTIKRNGDRVILKGGKVSCSCCEEPGECCMYPAQALADGLYAADDLPDAVDFTYSASGNTFGPYTLTRTGTAFMGGPGDEVVIALIEGAGLWGSADGGGGLESFPCLINETFQPSGGGGYEITVEDQFADTYYLSATFPPPYEGLSFSNQPLFRTSLCSWISGFYGLYYMSYPFRRNFWLVTFPGIDGTESYNERMNTPVGQYEDRFGVTNIFISE